MPRPSTPDNSLMALIVRRCGLDAAAADLLQRIEAAAWDLVADGVTPDVLRAVLAVLADVSPAPAGLPPRARRLLRKFARAREAGVPADVAASFTEDALRLALLIDDAFQRGHALGRAEAMTPIDAPARGTWPH
ncbi:hypothetical protein [Nannocystis punicea]|uniref:Uncharacterized protein n=1 Tax=Nannocystis punicea TaxID=2995304 RepID=A0ABY7HKI3_9BACT|nr:hypothetical protein [Nannocystis poenicansa]WAS99409.1 hypothetical protein O0S08_25055 [Nannocystis poenicansa]